MTTEALLTEATTTAEGTTTSEQAAQQLATGADESSQQQVTQGQQAGGAKIEGAPESYEFVAPEGREFSPEVLEAVSDLAKELNLPQDDAQKIIDKLAPALAARQANAIDQARTEWANAAKADKEFGGQHLAESLGVANKALDAFATPELRALLTESGLGNHPEVIRMLYRTGKAISEDRFVAGQATKTNQGDARRLYAASNMNP